LADTSAALRRRWNIGAALLLIVFVVVMTVESFSIRKVVFSSLPAEAWPRVLLAGLALLSVAYLYQSIRGRVAPAEIDEILNEDRAPGWGAALGRFANPAICFATFLTFLLTLPLLGMLIGGIGFVFATLCLLGPKTARATVLHAVIALVSVTCMWLIFTYGLGVFLPRGKIMGWLS
jgi:hypothetical protein